MAKDLTRGNPLKIILLFSIPLAIGNACNQLYSMVDSVIVGRWCGPEKLAAVGNAGSVIFMLLGFFWGLPAGLTIITGQRFGAKDASGVRRSFCASIVLCSAFVAAVTLVFLRFLRPILTAMNTPEDILEDSLRYLRIIVAGTPAMTFYLLMSFLMRSLGDSKRPLYVIVFASILNAGLDLLLVRKYGMGVSGAAYATVASQFVSGLICLGIILKDFPELLPKGREDWRFDWRFHWDHLRVAAPMALQFTVTGFGCVILQSAFNRFGPDTVAATTAAGRLEGLICIPFFAIGTTLAAYTAQNSGANNYRRILVGVRSGWLITAAISAAGAVLMIVFSSQLLQMFLDKEASPEMPEILRAGRQYIWTVAPAYISLGMILIFRNTLQGMGCSLVPLLGGAMETVSRIFTAVFLAEWFGYTGACFASGITWTITGVMLWGYYAYEIRARLKGKRTGLGAKHPVGLGRSCKCSKSSRPT